MRNFEIPEMKISMFDSIVTTTEEGNASVSIVQPVMTQIAALANEENALVGRTSFNALMQVN